MKAVTFLKLSISLAVVLSSAVVFASGKKDIKPVPKISRPGVYQGYSYKQYKGYSYSSYYIPMRDSVLLAVDIYLPKKLEKGKKIPTILYLDRYVRSVQAKFPFNLIKDPIPTSVSEQEIIFFTSYGYAVAVVDVRGTGASLGERKMEFGVDEVADGNNVVNWLIAQPWSNQIVGATGVSYLGTTAEMLLANENPHVKACIPVSAIFDLYDDIIFPGGVLHGAFVDVWGATTRALDHNDFTPFGRIARLLARGIHPVKGDKGRAKLKQAIALHQKNFDITKGIGEIAFRDDIQTSVNAALEDFSVCERRSEIEASATPIYRIDGWYDGGLAKGALDAWLNTKNTLKVLIGPWDHGPRGNVSPYATSKKLNFDILGEMLRFFDRYLKNIQNGIDDEPVLSYYTVGEETWKESSAWPPVNEKTLKMYLSADKNIKNVTGSIQEGTVNYAVDYTATSGNTSRWNSLTDLYMHGPTGYPDRAKEDEKLLSFTSDQLNQPMEIAGHPLIHLHFAADADDATVFCYLEDVGPDSSVTYVTEGMLRPLHRKAGSASVYKTCYPDHSYKKADALPYKKGETIELTVDLLPISYQFKKDHRLRLSIGGSDVDHFTLPVNRPAHFQIIAGQVNPSFIELPVVSE